LIVGEGPEEARLREQARELGVTDRVVFVGMRTDVTQLIHASALLLLPSEHEALPTTLIEAAACGRPAISTDIDGVPEVVLDGETGLLFPVGDVPALAEAVMALLGDEDRRREMGQRARLLAQERFDARRWAQRLYSVYAQVCDGRRLVSGATSV
jgi:glycosyltransferase involved in cell wall biosynthesis